MGLKSMEFVRGTLVTLLSERRASQMRAVGPPRYFFPIVNARPIGSYAIDCPSGDIDASYPLGNGSFSSTPPSAGTVNISAKREYAALGELKTMRLPSGVQPRTRSGAGCQVSLFGTPPEAGTTKTSTLPSYSPVKAMRVPSGENAGSVSLPLPLVRRTASPPSRGTLQRSPA